MTEFEQQITQPHIYIAAIEKLRSRNHYKSFERQANCASIQQIYIDREKISQAICADISAGIYQPNPAKLIQIDDSGKIRTAYKLSPIDRAVNMAIYQILSTEFDEYISDNLWSYRKGRSRYQPMTNLANKIKNHVKATSNPKDRGMYVFRTDIQKYGSSIGVYPSAPLWTALEKIWLKHYGNPMQEGERCLLEHLIRPRVYAIEGEPYELIYGIPDGTSLSAWLLNFYISPIDDALGSIDGAFYARYGDDILFAHEDCAITEQALSTLASLLQELELTYNQEKTRHIYFNAAGRASDVSENFIGANTVEFLGLALSFTGNVSLDAQKSRELIKTIKKRLNSTRRALGTKKHRPAPEGSLELFCEVVNSTLKPESIFEHSTALVIKKHINNRAWLRQLDYTMAKLVVAAQTGSKSVKSFRYIPYRELRNSGLYSLEYARNV